MESFVPSKKGEARGAAPFSSLAVFNTGTATSTPSESTNFVASSPAEGVRLELDGSPDESGGLASSSCGPYASLSDELCARLREHAKHHSREHIAVMEKLLGSGRSWEDANTLADAQVGE
jgi:hypothetical protein